MFISAIDLENHPLKNARKATKAKYFYVLQYYVSKCTRSIYAEGRLKIYKKSFIKNSIDIVDFKRCESDIVFRPSQYWQNKYKYWLICDMALICCGVENCKPAINLMKSAISRKQVGIIDNLIHYLESGELEYKKECFESCENLIEQYWKNKKFCETNLKTIVITANMSAGKSTLINAIIGKDIARTSQEVCTGNLCYFYNLPFNESYIHFKGTSVNFSATSDEYKKFEWNKEIALALHFESKDSEKSRLCLIDTPGVNSSVNQEHGQISKEFIGKRKFDQLLYILNANKLGTDEEIAYLKWICKNISEEKVIFVINKLDNFNKSEDNIKLSIDYIRRDLQTMGYKKPQLYPISAYFAYLLKKEVMKEGMDEDEIDELQLFKKRFLKPYYNLSTFYDCEECGNDYEGFLKRSGFFYLEKKIMEG